MYFCAFNSDSGYQFFSISFFIPLKCEIFNVNCNKCRMKLQFYLLKASILWIVVLSISNKRLLHTHSRIIQFIILAVRISLAHKKGAKCIIKLRWVWPFNGIRQNWRIQIIDGNSFLIANQIHFCVEHINWDSNIFVRRGTLLVLFALVHHFRHS